MNLWRLIFETASVEEIEYVLQKTKLCIPGFRATNRKDAPRSQIVQTITKGKKWNAIQKEYQKMLELNTEEKLRIDNPLRQKIIQLVLIGDHDSIIEAESLGCQLTLPIVEKKDSVIKDSIINENDRESIQEWQKKYKKLENEAKKQQQRLEQKYEDKSKETNELRKKKNILEKNHQIELSKLKENILKIVEEKKLGEKRINELDEATKVLKDEIAQKDEKIQEFLQEAEFYEEQIKNYSQQLEELLLRNNSGGEDIADNGAQEEVQQTIKYSGNKIKILVIGETTTKYEELKNLDLEFIHAQGINMEDFKERRDLATIIIMLSWTLTMSMQRKLKKDIPSDKLNEFHDYTSFRDYIAKKECISYVCN